MRRASMLLLPNPDSVLAKSRYRPLKLEQYGIGGWRNIRCDITVWSVELTELLIVS
jgi:hypothetical protein